MSLFRRLRSFSRRKDEQRNRTEVFLFLLQNVQALLKVLMGPFDRKLFGAGLGNSGPSSSKRTADQMVKELKALLAAAGVKPPYLFVAHSFGAVIARLFASRYSDEVIGMVLLDPACEDQEEKVLDELASPPPSFFPPRGRAKEPNRGVSFPASACPGFV